MKTLGTHNYYVYILTNKSKSVLYTGITNNLNHRIRFHREDANLNKKAFTSKYNCFYLIFYEHYNDINIAITREKQLKGWRRVKKEKLISDFNPDWKFLNDDV
ncbi:MAG: GIY-YIG nuclease family protein [Bacteroidia bacterium]|nr:GIY-YIG nuclease family protein [Bacteroidia bacterium]NNK60964.1 GIY-YIG nuclease family protein [Flavobacteriaceae bacterium]NNL31603.1 GIY-YIG nuclease family protein [Flavobacteriaceae bacterium]